MNDIPTLLRKLTQQDVFEGALGKVIDVDTFKMTCTVQPLETGPNMLEVRLSAVESPTNGIIPVPAVDSWVFVSQTALDQPHIVMFSELDSYTMKFNNTEFKLSEDGMKVTKGANDMKQGFEELLDQIKLMTFNTSVGPTSVACNITAIETAMNKIIETLD